MKESLRIGFDINAPIRPADGFSGFLGGVMVKIGQHIDAAARQL
jgi:hypothetical protein